MISTLVKDIYALLESGKVKLDASKLATMISNRLEAGGSGPSLRMSTLGEKCLRKLWYKEHRPEKAQQLKGNVLLNFLLGDIIEEVVLQLAEQTSHTVEGRQDSLDLHGVPGHRDAIIDGVLVDVKSANARSFDKFSNHKLETDDPFGYLDQAQAYLEASKGDNKVKVHDKVAFLAVNKELGHLKVDTYDIKRTDWKDRIESIRRALGSKDPPPRAYVDIAVGSSGNRQLPLPCRYCQYKNECWPSLRTFIYADGPRYLTQVKREPDVPELIKEKNSKTSQEAQE